MSIPTTILLAQLMILALLTIPASILIRMFERGTASIKRVGGLTFIKIGRLNISFSVAKKGEIEREYDANRRTIHRSLTKQLNAHWIQLGKQAHKRRIDLLIDTKFARIDSQLKQVEWTPDDWMIGFDDFDSRPMANAPGTGLSN